MVSATDQAVIVRLAWGLVRCDGIELNVAANAGRVKTKRLRYVITV
jgi:hypothetical protein